MLWGNRRTAEIVHGIVVAFQNSTTPNRGMATFHGQTVMFSRDASNDARIVACVAHAATMPTRRVRGMKRQHPIATSSRGTAKAAAWAANKGRCSA